MVDLFIYPKQQGALFSGRSCTYHRSPTDPTIYHVQLELHTSRRWLRLPKCTSGSGPLWLNQLMVTLPETNIAPKNGGCQ